MSSWGKGGFVGINKAISRHERVIEEAKRILRTECGKVHKLGEHGLCPICKRYNDTLKEKK